MIEKAKEIKKIIAQAPKLQIQQYQNHMDSLLTTIRSSRNYFRYIVHVLLTGIKNLKIMSTYDLACRDSKKAWVE